MLLALVLVSLNILSVSAQKKVPDSAIVGVWYMQSYHWDDEDIVLCKDIKYTYMKVFRADGEYAGAEVAELSDGRVIISGHEYGKYTLKDGIYSEMGRPEEKLRWLNESTISYRWTTRNELLKKLDDFPKDAEQYIVDVCKVKSVPKNVQNTIKERIF